VAPNRSPQLEAWGIAIKVLQATIAASVGYLAFTRPHEAAGRRQPT